MERSEIRTVMKYEFLRGTTASQTAQNINNVFGSSVTTQQIVSNWFAKFRTGNFDLSNELRGRPKSKVNNDELMVTVESDPSQSTYELSLKFGVSKQTILTHLAQIGKVKKLDKWIPQELNEKQKQKRLEACFLVINLIHFLIELSLVMRNGSNMTIANVQHSGWTRMNHQNTFQSAIFIKRS